MSLQRMFGGRIGSQSANDRADNGVHGGETMSKDRMRRETERRREASMQGDDERGRSVMAHR